ncbi:MAG TPA: hypothetical protein VN798_02920, partial [Pseudomonas sp.]|nr:hypothetical protein [Pseudomonas sp.]
HDQRMARQHKPDNPDIAVGPIQSALERVRAQETADGDAALKQARINLAMSRAQLNKSLKAFGHPPIAEQAARLVELQREFDDAEQALARLPATAPPAVVPRADQPDGAAMNRARIQLAMLRAALKKAQSAQASVEQISAMSADVAQAEQALAVLQQAIQ